MRFGLLVDFSSLTAGPLPSGGCQVSMLLLQGPWYNVNLTAVRTVFSRAVFVSRVVREGGGDKERAKGKGGKG